ncbi:hypothetical protein ROLI_041090 [Roseobacter fucihabitans]|uniref:Uncharacterized protein n=1 Tax=Roseobacter fucihabitans TaxID=1537242 RepID=A0ABZ2C090_9RHOB|nr:hypothetical protein [Roseobacter litoralis]MBC6965111.1 hypothetical protein [Roseobacter litoralis]MBC6965886.1 hypothetical protein [Roseobacter litoralis]
MGNPRAPKHATATSLARIIGGGFLVCLALLVSTIGIYAVP